MLNLEQNTSYSFLMTCSDREDNLWSSEKINFDTGETSLLLSSDYHFLTSEEIKFDTGAMCRLCLKLIQSSPSYNNSPNNVNISKRQMFAGVVISSVDPKLGAIFSPRRQEIESANRDIRSK